MLVLKPLLDELEDNQEAIESVLAPWLFEFADVPDHMKELVLMDCPEFTLAIGAIETLIVGAFGPIER